jgi:AraC-like DNA-binding protein
MHTSLSAVYRARCRSKISRVDLLSEVVRSVRVGSARGRVIRRSGTRGLRFPAFEGSGFHIVTRGTCWLISEEEPVALRPGDIVLALSGAAHGLSSVPCALNDLPPVVMGPFPPAPGPFDFEFVCGAYRLEHGRAPVYLRTMPDLITVSPDYDRHPEMRALVDLLRVDMSGTRMGTEATLPALLDLILVHALRQWHDLAGWPETADPAIATVLREIHEFPQTQWTVGKLSEIAEIPRAAFTRRFTRVVGQPPMSYLISSRLRHGAQLLRQTDAPLAAIARQVGYSTEFAFSNAFRREYGVSPSRYRRSPAVPRLADGTSLESAGG